MKAQLAAMTAARDDLLDWQSRSKTCIARLNTLLTASEAARGRMRKALKEIKSRVSGTSWHMGASIDLIAREALAEPILDLGALVEFVIEDYYGRPAHHVIPLDWCLPCERPNLAKRVK